MLSFGLLLGLLAAWYVTLAPTTIGGPATFVLVDGRSMEPTLYTGDVGVALAQPAYGVGDLVVYRSDGGGMIVHRIVDGSAQDGWLTQGDHNDWVDPWVVPDEAIAGTYAFSLPGVGGAITTARERPFALAGVLAAVTAVSYLPWRRRRLSPVLRLALASASKEPRRDGRSNAEYAVLITSAAGALLSLALVGVAALSRSLVTVQGAIAVGALLLSGGLTLAMMYRLYDGVGVAEPSRSMYALAGRLHLVEMFPEVGDPQPVRSAVELRSIAEKYRLPVLHRIDPVTGAHAFLLLTVQRGPFLWAPPLPALPVPTPPAPTPPAPPSPPADDSQEHRTPPLVDAAPGRRGSLTPAGAGLAALEARFESAAVTGPATAQPRLRRLSPPRGTVRAALGVVTGTGAVWALTANLAWLLANPGAVVVLAGGLAAVVVGGLVLRLAPDDVPRRAAPRRPSSAS